MGVVSSGIALKGLVVSNVPPPLLGFNNNVRHRGRVFHIQTEDSGAKSPRIVTHLFADGGRIIRTTRTEYTEHVARPDMQVLVRSLMKEQHKAMFMALRTGELDAELEEVCGPFEQPLQVSQLARPDANSAPPSSGSISETLLVSARASAPDFDTPPLASAFGEEERPSQRTARPPLSSKPPTVVAQPGVSRPTSPFAAGPSRSSSSIFGDGVISEQSLDEVILSYLAEDSDGSSK